jgi:hypothetical protein
LFLQGSESTPYNVLAILPYPQDLLYIEGLLVTDQLSGLEDKELIDNYFRLINPYPKYIQFLVVINNENKTIDKEN